MNLHDAFLADIREHPEDDAPRLIYADWLDEHAGSEGERARAEFIRLQVELERTDPDDPRLADGEARAEELLLAYRDNWFEPFEAMGATGALYRRGMLEEITLPSQAFCDHAEALFRMAPLLRRLKVRPSDSEPGAVCERLAGQPGVSQLTDLDISGNNTGEDGVRVLTSSPYLTNLRSLDLARTILFHEAALNELADWPGLEQLRKLDLAGNDLQSEQLLPLASSPRLTRLQDLDLNFNFLSTPDIAGLAASPSLTRLEVLDLGSNSLSNACVEILARSPVFARLTWLDLQCNHIGPEGARELAESPHLTGLVGLTLKDNSLGDDGFRFLAASRRWQELCYLSAGDTESTREGVRALLAAPWVSQIQGITLCGADLGGEMDHLLRALPDLDELALLGAGITGSDVLTLAHSPNAARLEHLDLNNNPLGNEGLRALATGAWPSLEILYLSRADIRPAGLRSMTESSWMQQLEALGLGGNPLGDAGARVLAEAPCLPRSLYLPQCGIGDAGALALARHPHIRNVDQLWLSQNPIGPEAAEALRQAAGARWVILDS